MPALAECGGFLYLQRSLEDPDGRAWPMAGVLTGEGIRGRGRQPFGYLTLRPGRKSPDMSFTAGPPPSRGMPAGLSGLPAAIQGPV